MVIPRPCCQCHVCIEAREKGVPYARGGPAAFLHDLNLLIDTPADISSQLNRLNIREVQYLMLTHLDPDHIEGLRVVELITLDFRSWDAYRDKQITLLLPEDLLQHFRGIRSQYGSIADFYETGGFLKVESFERSVEIDGVRISALPVDRVNQTVFIYVFEKEGRKSIYAPCDIKPFPENNKEVQNADLLVIQPGIFEDGIKHDFRYPPDHISRTTLYTFEQTLELAERIRAKKIIFTHLEEYWGRSYDDYIHLKSEDGRISFAYDGIMVEV
ncbi:MAG: MBL fold metallo-hydrolase [Syntrophales bacterium]